MDAVQPCSLPAAASQEAPGCPEDGAPCALCSFHGVAGCVNGAADVKSNFPWVVSQESQNQELCQSWE